METPGETVFESAPTPSQQSLSFLSPEEQGQVPEPVRVKVLNAFAELTRNFHNAVNSKQKERVSYEQRLVNVEGLLKEHREKTETLNAQLMTERKTTEEYIERYRKALTSTNELEDSVRKLQTSQSETQIKWEQLTADKEELVSIVDKRNSEIEKLTLDVKNLSDQLQSATMAKIEALVKVDELTSKEMELDYKEKQIEKERDWVSKQVQLLNEELDRKNAEIIEAQRDANLKYLNLQAEVSEKAEQLRIAELSLENVKSSNEKQEKHIERLIEKLKDAQDMETKIQENYRQELKSQKRIADLYKDSSEESSKKVDELEDAISNLQDLLKMATERYGELETKFNRAGKSFQEEISSRDESIQSLTKELSHANELLTSIKKQGMTDEMIQSLSPAAAAATSMLKNTHSLTEIYSRYQGVQEALLLSRDENEKLNNYIAQILRDIEDRAPILKAQKEDYERALETVGALTAQLDLAMDSENIAKEEFAGARKSLGVMERENARLKTQLTDSAVQIKTLLREIERARNGTFDYSNDNDPEQARAVPDVMNSSRLISDRLVTFRNIDELQTQNQYLLSVVRELSDERETAKETVDQGQATEMKESFQAALKELENLRDLRSRHERMLQSVLEQRDSYAALLDQRRTPTKGSPSRPLTFGSPADPSQATTQVRDLERKLFEAQTTGKQVREEFDTYRKEKSEHEKIASEQMERLRDDLTRMRTDNAKLASQTEYNNERAKIYSANLESYKKNLGVLEEKNKACALTIMKHEQSIVTLKAELSACQQKLARTEVGLSTMAQERNTLRDAKSRLQAERDLFQREQSTQKILQTNLADIKNNLEMSNSASKIKLENQVESLEQENRILRRKVDSENEKFKDTVLSWDKINKDLTLRLERETEAAESMKKDLLGAQDTIRANRAEIDELLSKVRVLTGTGGTSEQLMTAANKQTEAILSLGQIELEKKTKELNLKLIEAQTEIRSLKQQIEIGRGSVEEYKALCTSMEDQLNSATEGTKNFNTELQERLACKDDIIREVQAKLDGIEKENTALKEERERTVREMEGKSTHLDEELTRMKRELQVANSRLQTATEESIKVKEDLDRQVKIAQEFQAQYEREISEHSTNTEVQDTLKSELDSLKSRVGEDERARIRAEERLHDIEERWESQEAAYKAELTQVQQNLKDLDSLNNSLQDQLVSLTTQMSSLRQAESTAAAAAAALNKSATEGGPPSLDTSFSASFIEAQDQSDQEKKTTDQWMQLIRYMRRQKEIAYTKTEMAEATVQRLESQLQFVQKQYEEVKAKLSQDQDSSHYSVITSAKQAELLRKVETLSALTDSNRMLREEKDVALREIQSLKSRLEALERELGPLRVTNAELESRSESLLNENSGLKQDLSRWRARAALLLEKSTKINPEEWKKLTTEKDGLTRSLAALQETNKRQVMESGRHLQTIKTLQSQVAAFQASVQTLSGEKKTFIEEAKRSSEEKLRLLADMEALRTETERVRAALAAKEKEAEESGQNLARAQAEVEEQKGVVRQVKGIARKYKKSYEDSLKENEALQGQKVTLEAAASTSSSAAASTAVETESSRQQASEVEATLRDQVTAGEARVQELTTQNESLQRDIETLRTESSQREERAKTAIKGLREKVSTMTSQRSEAETELNSCRARLGTLEVNSEESAVRLAALKSQYEGRLGRLEKENKDLKAAGGSSSTAPTAAGSNLQAENERLRKENEMQRQRISALEKQFQLKQAASAAGSSKTATAGTDKAHPTEPPKANIKPIAGTSSSGNQKQTTQVVPPGTSRPQPTASIRPMSMTRKAMVMPTTAAVAAPTVSAPTQQQVSGMSQQQQQQGLQGPSVVAPVSQAQVSTSTPDQSSNSADGSHHLPVTSSASTGTVTNSTNVRQATVQPTPAISVAPISSASHSVVGTMASSGSGTGTVVTTQQVPTSGDRESLPTASGSQQEGPSTSHMEDSEMGDSSEQVSSSEPSNHQPVLTVAPIRSQSQQQEQVQQSSQVQAGSSHAEPQTVSVGREEPSPSTSTSGPRPTQSSKRTRDNEVETSEESSQLEDEPEPKRTRVTHSRPMPVEREAEAMAHQQEEREADGEEEEELSEATPSVPKGRTSRPMDEEDDDSDVIVIESDEEEEEEEFEQRPASGRDEDEEMGEEEVVEEEDEEVDEVDEDDVDAEEEVEEDDLEGEDRDEDDEDGDAEALEHGEEDVDQPDEDMGVSQEGREAESLEDQEDEVIEGENQETEAEVMLDEAEENEEDEDEEEAEEHNIVHEEINLVDDEEDVQQAGEASPVSQGGQGQAEPARPQSSSSRPQPLPRPSRQDRVPSYAQRYQLPMTPSFPIQTGTYGGEEIDDSIVPSTPTLFVPRRSDGFAEAVSSPQVPTSRRFTFSTPSDTTTGNSGLEDTRMDLLHYDEGSGRSVPTTPLQVSPPAEIGDVEAQVSGHEEGEELLRESTPSSSDNNRHANSSFASVPSITITSGDGPQEQEPESGDADLPTEHMDLEPGEVVETGNVVPSRTESSVTSSDEDKVDTGPATTSDGLPQQPSTSSIPYRTNSPTPSTGTVVAEQPSHSTNRVRPVPIVWDQPTSSSQTPGPVPQQQQQQQVPRVARGRGGMGRGGLGMHLGAEPGAHPPLLRGFRPLRGAQQSARRSRPHGPRGLTRGNPRDY